MKALLCYGTTLYGPRLVVVANEAAEGDDFAVTRALAMLRTIGESLTVGDLEITGETDAVPRMTVEDARGGVITSDKVTSLSDQQRLARLEAVLRIEQLLDVSLAPGEMRYLMLRRCPICGGASRVQEYGGCDFCGNVGVVLTSGPVNGDSGTG